MRKENYMSKANNNFHSFPLFNDVEEVELRTHNRAAIMVNIFEDGYSKDNKGVGKVSDRSTLLIIGYMNKIPEGERKETINEFVRQANKRGFEIA